MNKPLLFAVRGGVGWSLIFFSQGLAWAMAVFAARGIALAIPSMIHWGGFVLGLAVLFYGTTHWIRGTLGFALTYIILSTVDRSIGDDFLRTSSGGFLPGVVELYEIVISALIGGVCACWKSIDLALPGAVAFGLPVLLLNILAQIAPDWAYGRSAGFIGTIFTGVLFGFFVGRSEARVCPTIQPTIPVIEVSTTQRR